jgi:hypothetical protein
MSIKRNLFAVLMLVIFLVTSINIFSFADSATCYVIVDSNVYTSVVLADNVTNQSTRNDLSAYTGSTAGDIVSLYALESVLSDGIKNELNIDSAFPKELVLKLIKFAESMTYSEFNIWAGTNLASKAEYSIAINMAVMSLYREHALRFTLDWDATESSRYKTAAQKLLNGYYAYVDLDTEKLDIRLEHFRTYVETSGGKKIYGPFTLAEGSNVFVSSNQLWLNVMKKEANAYSSVTSLSPGEYYIGVDIGHEADLGRLTFINSVEKEILKMFGDGYNRFVCKIPETVTTSEMIEFNAMDGTAAIRVVNISGITGDRLNGGIYQIINDAQSIIEFTISDNGSWISGNLPLGSYVLKQKTPASGYKAISPILINLTSANRVEELFVQSNYGKGEVNIDLKDVNNEFVGDGVLEVFNMENVLQGTITTTNGSGVLTLVDGDYYVVQSVAPIGWIADTSKHYFTLSGNNTVNVSVKMYATQGTVGSLRFIIKDSQTYANVGSSGIISLYSGGNFISQGIVSVNGVASIEAIPIGTYIMTFNLSRNDYYYLEQSSVVLVEGSTTREYVIYISSSGYDTPYYGGNGSADIYYVDGGYWLGGVFYPYVYNGNYTSDYDTTTEYDGGIKVTLSGDSINKVTVRLYNSNKKRISTLYSDRKGITEFDELESGTYYIVVPDSSEYYDIDTAYKVKVGDSTKKISIDLDDISTTLPETRGTVGIIALPIDVPNEGIGTASVPSVPSIPTAPSIPSTSGKIDSVKVIVTSKSGLTAVSGAVIQVKTASGKVLAEGTSKKDGTVTLNTDIAAEYLFIQKSVPSGFTLDSEIKRVMIDGIKKTVYIDFNN